MGVDIFSDLAGLAVDEAFNIFGVDAIYTGTGQPVSLRIRLQRPDEMIDGFNARIVAPTVSISVRTKDVLKPEPGDLIQSGGINYRVQGAAHSPDPRRLTWAFQAVADEFPG